MESSLFIAFLAASNAPSTMCSPRAFATRARRLKPAPGNHSGMKRTVRSREHAQHISISQRQMSASLRTRREDVDEETAGDDGILNNLVCLTGELHILSGVVSDRRGSEAN